MAKADVVVLRAEPGVHRRIASHPTVWRTVDALAAAAPLALAVIDTARAVARAEVWRLTGPNAPDHEMGAAQPLVIDVDAALVTSHSGKEGARPIFKRGYGHHPLWVFADHGRDGPRPPAGSSPTSSFGTDAGPAAGTGPARTAKDTGLANLPLHGMDQNRIWCAVVAAGLRGHRPAADAHPDRACGPTVGTETAAAAAVLLGRPAGSPAPPPAPCCTCPAAAAGLTCPPE